MICILVIDDDCVFRATLQDMLEGVGYHVLEACDGQEGLAALQAHPIDLVITDILMLEQVATMMTRLGSGILGADTATQLDGMRARLTEIQKALVALTSAPLAKP